MKTMHLLAGEYGSEAGGVGAYSEVLVEALSRRGLPVRVWDVHDPAFQRSLPDALRTQPGALLLQVCQTSLARAARTSPSASGCYRCTGRGRSPRHVPRAVPVLSRHPARNVLAPGAAPHGRHPAALVVAHVYLDGAVAILPGIVRAGRMTFTVLPIPSTLPDNPPAASVAEWRTRLCAGFEQIAVHCQYLWRTHRDRARADDPGAPESGWRPSIHLHRLRQ